VSVISTEGGVVSGVYDSRKSELRRELLTERSSNA